MGSRKRGGGSREAAPSEDEATFDDEAEREAVIARLFDGVMRSARCHLLQTDEPLAAEIWASGLLAVWDALPSEGPGGPALSPEVVNSRSAFGDAFVRHALALGTPESMAALVALAGVAPARLATQARPAVADLKAAGVPAPAWAARVGTAVPTEAWVGRDLYGDQQIVLVGFEYPESAPEAGDVSHHSVCVLVDHVAGGAVRDAYPAAPLEETLARWREAQAEVEGLHLRPASLAEASGRLASALAATDFGDGRSVPTASATCTGPNLAELRAFLAARLATLPPAGKAGQAGLDPEARQGLVAEFLSSPEAADLLVEPAVVDVCQSLVSYRCDFGDGDPRRWSPTLALLCLLEHFPARVSLDDPDVGLVPDVLSAWVRFSGRDRRLPEEALVRILDVITVCRDDFVLAMRDDAQHGPDKRLSGEMAAEGIDLTDDAALSEWMATDAGWR